VDVATIIDRARTTGARFTLLGGRGFVGAQLAQFLAQHDIAFSCPERGDDSIFTRTLGHVIYCVGLTADYIKRPFDTVEAHVGLLASVLERASFQSLVYLSSTRLYDSAGARGVENAPLVLDPQQPRHLFDLSKALGESLCLQAVKNARVARLSSVYAPDLTSSNFLHELIRVGATQSTAVLDTSPSLARDYIDISDVCSSLVAIALAGRRPIYNVASGQNVTNEQIFEQIERVTGCRISGSKPSGIDHSPAVDVTAIEEDFAIVPQPVLRRITEILNTHRQGA
jgi:nucleoside-diphosphate-sugar epimerase